MRLSQQAIARQRLAAQHLSRPTLARPEQVVELLGAVQAQDYPAAKWAIGQRCKAVRDVEVERAFNDGAIVRTHVLRPTWHFVRPADLRWMLALTGPRIEAGNLRQYRRLGLDEVTLRRSRRVIEKALRGTHLTRQALAAKLTEAGIRLSEPQRFVYIMMRAELDGVVCSGPRDGKQQTYALVDARLAPTAAISRDESLARLARTYFSTRGPATLNDFGWWSGLTVGDGRRAVEVLGAEIERAELHGRPHWVIPGESSRRATHRAQLLPNYDEYFIGFRDRSAIALRAPSTPVVSPNPLERHIAIVDGQLIGGWTSSGSPKPAAIRIIPVTKLSSSDRHALGAAAKRYSDFLGVQVEAEVATVSASRQ